MRPEEREEFKSYQGSKYYPLTQKQKAAARRAMKTIPRIEIINIVRVIAMSAFAGALTARYANFSNRQVLFFTAIGAGTLISAAIFGMVIEAASQ
jgi:hypothetical protein